MLTVTKCGWRFRFKAAEENVQDVAKEDGQKMAIKIARILLLKASLQGMGIKRTCNTSNYACTKAYPSEDSTSTFKLGFPATGGYEI